jgi:AbiV family abortive infection protein
MSDDDQLTSWMGKPESAIRRTGELNETEVADATVSYLRNGVNLLLDARLLISNERFSRGAALVVLGLEELAKIKIIVETFLKYEHGVDREAWKKYWKAGGNHKSKQEEILSYGKIIRASYDGDPIHGRYLYRYYAPNDALERLDWFKQSNFYVDIRDDGIHAPGRAENLIKATDYLLAFAQERADSYMSWHISRQRAIDQLQVALGKRASNVCTRSFRLEEVQADLLYQVSALSASLVPNYCTFYDFIKSYLKKTVAERRVKDALLNLASEIRLRIIESEKLPLFQSRYIGAYKLICGVSENSGIFGASFNQELKAIISRKHT